MSELAQEPVVASDGYRLAHRIWENAAPRATVVVLTGVMSHSAWFESVGGPLAEHGLRVVAMDRRGSGANQVERGTAPSPEVLIDDVRLFVERYRARGPVFLLGWCWGAVLAVASTLEIGAAVDGLILAAPGIWPSELVRDRIRAEQARISERDLDEVCVRNPVTEEMFTDGEGLAFIRADNLRLREFTPRFFRISGKLGAIASMRLRRLEQPLLLLLAERDEAVDNARTLAAFGQLDAERLTVRTLDSRHGIPFDAPDAFVHEVARWVEECLTKGAQHAG